MRLIDKETMLNLIIDAKRTDPETGSFAEWLAEYLVERLPTLTPQNEWVSVEDRLPGASGNYICAAKDKNGCAWTIPGEWNVEMKTWFGEFGEIKNVVTHWMPLPAPPDRRPPERQEDTNA